MKRKRLTECFPWLLPLRKKQRVFCFYTGMALDRREYAQVIQTKTLPYLQAESSSPLYNRETGFDMKYQENKVFNLKLASKKLDGLLIRPGETFSFWKAVRYADREIPYRDGLTVVNGKMETTAGGGMCQMSNLLFELFVKSPFTIVERKGHVKKEFPDPGTSLAGIDATINEGWIDLKVENKTDHTFQIRLSFDREHIYGYLRADGETEKYQVFNRGLHYIRTEGKVYQKVSVYRRLENVCDREQLLYTNVCEIQYPLPEDVEIREE